MIPIQTTNLNRLKLELGKDYFEDDRTYEVILTENNLDPHDEYDKANDHVNLLESVYAVLQTLANNIDIFRKVETEFTTTSAAYQYLQVRLKDVRNEIERVKRETHYADSNGDSSITSYLFFNRYTEE